VFYSQLVFPCLCDLLLNKPFVAKHRRELLAHACGEILEIGFGTGLNLPHYPSQVRKITTVDPNTGMHRLAQKRVKNSGIEVDQRILSSEKLPFSDDAFDSVVSTFTLCSIENVQQSLAEIHRVLKPGGNFLFLEHGLSPVPGVQKWQRRLNWLEIALADGCHLDRDIERLVTAQPFSSVEVTTFYLEGMPKTHGYTYRGLATK
ncbi:MAG: class I SAM-dependent methyltransferase, partial [Planctomycetes bacterium]|nr:class I SAM-dependent methyltransferase [Planctomycetota bacterium]